MNVFVRIYCNSFAVFNRHYVRECDFREKKKMPDKGIFSDNVQYIDQDFFSLERLTAERIPAARQIKPITA